MELTPTSLIVFLEQIEEALETSEVLVIPLTFPVPITRPDAVALREIAALIDERDEGERTELDIAARIEKIARGIAEARDRGGDDAVSAYMGSPEGEKDLDFVFWFISTIVEIRGTEMIENEQEHV